MIQRIQTVYLFLAAALTIVLLFLPIGTLQGSAGEFTFDVFALTSVSAGAVALHTFYIAAMLIGSAIISLVTIFLYKNRKRQMTLTTCNLALFLLALVFMFYICPDLIFAKSALGIESSSFVFNYWILICILPPFGMFLANRAIRKDEALVRAADRLR